MAANGLKKVLHDLKFCVLKLEAKQGHRPQLAKIHWDLPKSAPGASRFRKISTDFNDFWLPEDDLIWSPILGHKIGEHVTAF